MRAAHYFLLSGSIAMASLASLSASAQPADVKLVSGNGVHFATNVDREVGVDLGAAVALPEQVLGGLFPEDTESPQQRKDRERCERLIQEGFKCMPPARSYTRFNLPGVSFKVGSAELPELMKQQLKTFADVLRGKSSAAPLVRIDGHADATGSSQSNVALSQQRAESVKSYLVSLGVGSGLLSVQGFGSKALRNAADPASADNRRVEIARNLPQ
ncbi:MAG: OmpA family protein [Rubrivivax sp.]|nr:OmpA family protein [Rubrivivax sp.]